MTERISPWVGIVVALLAFSTEASTAHAQEIQGVRIELHAGAAWNAHAGVGVRAEIPIVREGFISRANDEVALSFGGDLFFFDPRGKEDHLDALALIAFQWTFYFGTRWSVSGEAGVGVELDGDKNKWLPHPALAGVGRWHFTSRNALVLRVGWPYVAFGITF